MFYSEVVTKGIQIQVYLQYKNSPGDFGQVTLFPSSLCHRAVIRINWRIALPRSPWWWTYGICGGSGTQSHLSGHASSSGFWHAHAGFHARRSAWNQKSSFPVRMCKTGKLSFQFLESACVPSSWASGTHEHQKPKDHVHAGNWKVSFPVCTWFSEKVRQYCYKLSWAPGRKSRYKLIDNNNYSEMDLLI